MGAAARHAGGARVPPLQHRWPISAPSISVVLSDEEPMADVPVAVGYVSSEATGVRAPGAPNLLSSEDESMGLLSSSPSPTKNPDYSPDHLSDLELFPEEGEILPEDHVNTKSSYLVCVCMQRMKFCSNFFVMLRIKYFLHTLSRTI